MSIKRGYAKLEEGLELWPITFVFKMHGGMSTLQLGASLTVQVDRVALARLEPAH